MKIMHVVQRYPPAVGGAEQHVFNVATQQAKEGHEVTVLTTTSMGCDTPGVYYPPLSFRTRIPNSRIAKIDETVNVVRDVPRFTLFSYLLTPGLFRYLWKFSKTFDIVHAHCYRFSTTDIAAIICRLRKRPFVLTGHDALFLDHYSLPFRYLDWTYKNTIGSLVINSAAKLIALTPEYFEDYRRFFRVPADKIEIVPNGIDIEALSNAPRDNDFRNDLGNPDHIILYVGRFIDSKGPCKAILYFSSLVKEEPNSVLVCIGKDYGSLRAMEKLVRHLNLENKVHIFESAPEALKIKALCSSDIFLYPAEYEAFGLSVLEAMAAGLTVVTNPVGGLRYLVVPGQTGMFLGKEPIQTIRRVLHDDVLRNSIATKAKMKASEFTWKKTSEKLLKAYQEVLQKPMANPSSRGSLNA